MLSPMVVCFEPTTHGSEDESIEGASWGTTVIGFDDGNGWVHVPGSGYLPKVRRAAHASEAQIKANPGTLPAMKMPQQT